MGSEKQAQGARPTGRRRQSVARKSKAPQGPPLERTAHRRRHTTRIRSPRSHTHRYLHNAPLELAPGAPAPFAAPTPPLSRRTPFPCSRARARARGKRGRAGPRGSCADAAHRATPRLGLGRPHVAAGRQGANTTRGRRGGVLARPGDGLPHAPFLADENRDELVGRHVDSSKAANHGRISPHVFENVDGRRPAPGGWLAAQQTARERRQEVEPPSSRHADGGASHDGVAQTRGTSIDVILLESLSQRGDGARRGVGPRRHVGSGRGRRARGRSARSRERGSLRFRRLGARGEATLRFASGFRVANGRMLVTQARQGGRDDATGAASRPPISPLPRHRDLVPSRARALRPRGAPGAARSASASEGRRDASPRARWVDSGWSNRERCSAMRV